MSLLPTSRTNQRGFTLIELMVVVVIIAVLAAIAVPLFAKRFQQQRVLQAAQRLAETYRGARSRALGRGAAIVVRFFPDTNTVTVLEGVQGNAAATNAQTAGCDSLPTRGCLTNNWGNVLVPPNVGTARAVSTEVLTTTVTSTAAVGGTAVGAGASLTVCFSPGGRAYVNPTGTWNASSWQALGTVLSLSVTGADRTHNVVVLPNGTARLGL